MSESRLGRATRLLARVRVVVYVGLVVGLGYYLWRYDFVQLPDGGCSPLEDVVPGARLIVDRHGEAQPGDAVLYRSPSGLLLGRVTSPPPSASAEVWSAVDAGALWVVKERDECPGEDSRRLGPLSEDDIAGRVAGSFVW